MSAEGATLIGIEKNPVVCRTVGAHFDALHHPDLTVGPIIFRPFGPEDRYTKAPFLLCNSLFRSPLYLDKGCFLYSADRAFIGRIPEFNVTANRA